MNIYEIKAGYLGGSRILNPGDSIPQSWTTEAPPQLAENEYAMWCGKWVKTSIPPMPPEPPHDPQLQKVVWDGTQWQVVSILPV